MNQFTCSHHSILIREKITTYLDAKGIYKKTCFSCGKLIQAKTPDFNLRIMYERVKLFPIQYNICGFHKDFYIQQIGKLPYLRNCYKIFEKHHVAGVIHKAFESTPVNISTW